MTARVDRNGTDGTADKRHRYLGSTAPYTHMIGKARELTEFCLQHGGRCFEGWPVKTLFSYVFFHLVDGGVFICRADGQVAAIMFAWGAPREEIVEDSKAGRPSFQWKRSRNHCDALFVAEVIGDMRRLPKLFKLAAAKWRDWERKEIFTYRQGPRGRPQLTRVDPAIVKRLILGKAPSSDRGCPDTGRPDSGQQPTPSVKGP